MSVVCSTHGSHAVKVVPVLGLPSYDVCMGEWRYSFARNIDIRCWWVVSFTSWLLYPPGNPLLWILNVFWDVTPCSLVYTWLVLINVETVGLSETLVPLYQITQQHGRRPYSSRRRRENLKHHSPSITPCVGGLLGRRAGNAPSRLVKKGDFLTDWTTILIISETQLSFMICKLTYFGGCFWYFISEHSSWISKNVIWEPQATEIKPELLLGAAYAIYGRRVQVMLV
jgi:hypothetical protein